MAQKAELRLAVRRGDEYGLVWGATLRGHDVYAGTPRREVSTRFSYHASGAGHVYFRQGQDRWIAPPSQPTTNLRGKQKVGGWPYQLAEWGYHVKPDTVHRKTFTLEDPTPRPLTVDLWLLEKNRPELAQEIVADCQKSPRQIVGQLHVSVTSPQLFAVVWTMTGPFVEDLLRATDHEQRRKYLS